MAHDTGYSIRHVQSGTVAWLHDCPLANNAQLGRCDGCAPLWDTGRGSLCTAPDSPLARWREEPVDQPDPRSGNAMRLAVMAMEFERAVSRQARRCIR